MTYIVSGGALNSTHARKEILSFGLILVVIRLRNDLHVHCVGWGIKLYSRSQGNPELRTDLAGHLLRVHVCRLPHVQRPNRLLHPRSRHCVTGEKFSQRFYYCYRFYYRFYATRNPRNKHQTDIHQAHSRRGLRGGVLEPPTKCLSPHQRLWSLRILQVGNIIMHVNMCIRKLRSRNVRQ